MPRRSPEYIFVREYEKLTKLITKITEDELSELSFLLRKLLLDGYYQRAAKPFKFKPIFTVTDFDHKSFKLLYRIIRGTGTYIVGLGDMLYPKDYPQLESKGITWKEFIDLPIGVTNDVSFTVSDLIKYEAYVEGAVHYREPCRDYEKGISKNNFFIGNLPMTLRQLRSISFVTIDALKPLYELIRSKKIET